MKEEDAEKLVKSNLIVSLLGKKESAGYALSDFLSDDAMVNL